MVNPPIVHGANTNVDVDSERRSNHLSTDRTVQRPCAPLDMPLSDAMSPRFLTLADVAETLNISAAQTYALVRSGELRAIKVGGRGQWRVEASELEKYISTAYEQTAEFVSAHPFGRDGDVDEED